MVSSASPPTLKSQRVATDIANQTRPARTGVYVYDATATLDELKALHALIPYQQASAISGGKSVIMNHGSLDVSSQYASKVHFSCLSLVLKRVP